ncbi:MAG: YtxH domain-containing protein, partial [Chitinophagales bacterium]|nr:YtxH domain-containing protein [Chitinophagales bacterium]
VLAGLAAGAAIGIMLAPDKGVNTRKRILKKGDDYVEELKDMFDDFIETISNRFESVKDDAGELIDDGKLKAKEVKDEAKNALHQKIAQHT